MALVLTLTPSTVAAGQTFQAAVTGAAPGEVITFTYDAAPPQSVTADAMGNASATFTGTTTGVVVAAGPTSGAATATLTISAAENCVITVTSTPANPTAGQPVTVTATVTCNGTPVQGATVLFATVNGPLGIGVTSAAGQASVTTSTLPSGLNVVTATVIAANTTCICVGTSATVNITVAAAQNCAITLSTTPANPTAGQPVTVTATVTCNGAPVQGATVLFATVNGPLGIGVTTAAGQASVTTSTLPAGANVITATVIAANTTCVCVGVSATATVNVGAAQSCVVTLSSTPANPTAGQPVTVTATVTCNGAPVQGATVLFATVNGPLGIGVTSAAGQASVTTSTLPAGANVITATVIAANTTCTCVGVSGTATVNVGASTGGLTANPACYTLNFPPLPWAFATATFSASGATPGAVVTFHLDGPSGPVVCTAVANASGNASCTATLNIGQVLYSSYTATTPSAGGTLSSSSTLGICLT
ncbi:Ig-like domain repeat protein [Streptomyces sp. NEAU-S7GS2]|uniref:Ig-like domain repeat protein n=1 Tax=Streptomyces sp. NEAU-S7GS2 TaxID=2202000 RepID=UPI00195263C7|nr:Ig-like domain repeat protein [Streptomyces sp. NEAU-S7GS2]